MMPSEFTIYLMLLVFCIAGSAFAGYALLRVSGENLIRAEKWPRAVIPGVILGGVDLLWCIPNAMPILPASFHPYLFPLAIVLLFLAWTYLDHLFSRAIGGFMILAAHALLKEAFASPVPGNLLFVVFCLIFGTVGIFISGKPHLCREIIRLGTGRFRLLMPVFLFLFAGISLWTFLLNLFSKGSAA